MEVVSLGGGVIIAVRSKVDCSSGIPYGKAWLCSQPTCPATLYFNEPKHNDRADPTLLKPWSTS
jgi:hypothetical protein